MSEGAKKSLTEAQADALLQEYGAVFSRRFNSTLMPYELAAIKTFLHWMFNERPKPRAPDPPKTG